MSKVAVLASGRGSNLRSILEAGREGRLGSAEVCLVLSDNQGARALRIARDHGVEAIFLDPEGLSRDAYDERMADELRQRDIDVVVLAGFMRVLSPGFVRRFEDRIINIHPAILPSFRGLDAQRQAIEAGVRIAGASTHFVVEEVDAGPIILQSAVPVYEDDTAETLADRILRTEHRILPETVRLMAEGRLSVEGDRVRIKGELRFPGGPELVPEVTP